MTISWHQPHMREGCLTGCPSDVNHCYMCVGYLNVMTIFSRLGILILVFCKIVFALLRLIHAKKRCCER